MESSQVSMQLGQAETVHHKFSSSVGLAANIELCSGNLIARRKRNTGNSLVFSAHCLDTEELFEVKIDEIDPLLSGGIKIGLVSLSQELKQLDSWLVDSSMVSKRGVTIKHNYGPCLERLSVGDKLGVKRTQEGGMRIVINGEDVGLACTGVSAEVRAVVGVTGCVTSVSVIHVIECSLHRRRVKQVIIRTVFTAGWRRRVEGRLVMFRVRFLWSYMIIEGPTLQTIVTTRVLSCQLNL